MNFRIRALTTGLVGISVETEGGVFQTDVREDVMRTALAAAGVVDLYGHEVFVEPFGMSQVTWERIRSFLGGRDTPSLPDWVVATGSLSFECIAGLPYRVYADVRRGLYLLHPIDFHSQARRAGWLYNLFSSEEDVAKVWVQPESGDLECEYGRVPNHFLKRAQQFDPANGPEPGRR